MKERKQKSIKREGIEWFLCLMIAFVITVFINSEVFAITEVKGPSMENTLFDGEKLYIDKISYHFSEPKAGDIIVFLEGEINEGFIDKFVITLEDIKRKFERNPRRNRYIKRVIGVPGDKIDILDGKVYVNDKLLDEGYIKGNTIDDNIKYPVTVPEGKLFVMGDNRENSKDSRVFGFVDYRSVEGKALFRIWPFDKLGSL